MEPIKDEREALRVAFQVISAQDQLLTIYRTGAGQGAGALSSEIDRGVARLNAWLEA